MADTMGRSSMDGQLRPIFNSANRVRGFTLVEVLVSIAIIALLTGLLLPAIQSARESARRAQCQSNLHQIGIALHNYESIYKCFPACGVQGISWEVAILPQMDRTTLYQKIDYLAKDRTANLKGVSVEAYLCPSDTAPTVFQSIFPVAATSYLGNSGTGILAKKANGVFNHFSSPFPNLYTEDPVRFADITDGLSTTAAVSECLHSIGGKPGDRLRVVWNTSRSYLNTEVDQFVEECKSVPSQPTTLGWVGSPIAHGYSWVFGDIGYSTYNHIFPLRAPIQRA
jgi:prepilin-type N-terminal cleavage/methylation domain-containing protein